MASVSRTDVSTDDAGGATFRPRDVALAAYGPTIISSTGHGAVMPILALRARDLGADVSTAAAVVAALGVGMLLASLPASAVVARVGERRALVVAGVVDAAARRSAPSPGRCWC